MSEIPYTKAKCILQDKFNTTEEEIIKWIETGKLNPIVGEEKIVLGWNFSAYWDDELRNVLKGLYFYEDAICCFDPEIRWLTFTQICERWAKYGETAKDVASILKNEIGVRPIDADIDNGKELNLYVYPLDVIERIEKSQFLLESQAKPATNDSAGSQAVTEPASTKVIQANSNDVKFSGLLNIPKKIDGWFEVIDDMTRDFHEQYKKIPNEHQAWAQLWTKPQHGYEITTGTDKGENCLNMPGVNPLSKSAFSKRWGNYTADKPR